MQGRSVIWAVPLGGGGGGDVQQYGPSGCKQLIVHLVYTKIRRHIHV